MRAKAVWGKGKDKMAFYGEENGVVFEYEYQKYVVYRKKPKFKLLYEGPDKAEAERIYKNNIK